MTTKAPTFPPGACIPKWVDPDTFVAPDPLPMPDAMHQEPHLTHIMHTVRRHFRGQPNTLVSGDSPLYYDRSDLNRRYEPDCYVAFGVDVDPLWARNGYMTWIAGKPPDFVLEIASESTWQTDMVAKRRDYARIGVGEYWRFDGSGEGFYDAPLAGDRLEDEQYVPIEITPEPDGSLWGYSAALDLYLCYDSGWLFLWDPKTGEFVRDIDASEDALAAERLAHQATQETLTATQEQLAEEQAARQADQETIRRLRAQLGEPEPE